LLQASVAVQVLVVERAQPLVELVLATETVGVPQLSVKVGALKAASIA
jgi:hypothetical protein